VLSSIITIWLLYFSSITERFFFNTQAFIQIASSLRISEQSYSNSFSNTFLAPQNYSQQSFLIQPQDPTLDLLDWSDIFSTYQICNDDTPLENRVSNGIVSPKTCKSLGIIKGSKSYVGNAEGSLRIGEIGQLPLQAYSFIVFSGRITSVNIEFNSPTLLLSLGRISAEKITCKNNAPIKIFSFDDINYTEVHGCSRIEIVPRLQEQQSILKKHFSSRRYLLYGILAKP
jgi:hypothetical protein